MEKQNQYEAYLKSTHRLGRIVSVITLVLLVGAPFAIGTLLGAGPDLGAVARGFLSVRQPDQYEDPLRDEREGTGGREIRHGGE